MNNLHRVILSLLCLGLLLVNGCAMAVAPVNGFWYTDVKGPLEANSVGTATKTGEATCKSVLGLVATGDASIEAAAKNGGITKIHHVDFKSWSLLGFYAEFTTIVHGE
jgi:hypothetical protein